MARLVTLEMTKTYATKANVEKAVEKKFGGDKYANLTYIIAIHDDGRFYPIFLGERALHAGVHFHFHVCA